MSAPTSSLAFAPIVVRDLSVAFGRRTVLDGLDLVAQPGRRIGLVGENGAGKSTLLRAIAGELPRHAHTSGHVDRSGGGWTAYSVARSAARRRWEETYAAQQEEIERLRAAARVDSSAVAHNRLLGVLSGRIAPTSGTVQVAAQRVAELTQDPEFPDLTAPAAAAYEKLVGADLAQQRSLGELGLLHPREHAKPLVGELEEAIGRSPGTIVIASHDRWLRRRWQGSVLEVSG